MSKKPLFSERELAEAEGAALASHDHIRWALEKCTDGPDHFFNACVERAQKGDEWAAREVLHCFCTCFESDAPVPRQIQRYLYLGFSRYLQRGGDAPLDKAMGLVAPAHRKKGTRNRKGKAGDDTSPLQLVAHVYLLMKRDGLRKGTALERTAEQFNLTRRALEGYDAVWKIVSDNSLEDLERLAQPVSDGPIRK